MSFIRLFHPFCLLLRSFFFVEELFGILDCPKDNQDYQSHNEYPRVIVIGITVPFLGIRITNECLKQQDDSKDIVDLIEMFELVWSFRAEDSVPDVDVDSEHQHHDSYVDLSGGKDGHSILNHRLEV